MADDITRWDNRYRTHDTPWDTGLPSSELVRVMAEDAIAPCTTLEIGCGTGTNAVWLASRGFTVTAVDVSPLAIEAAKQKAMEAGVAVQFLVADVLSSPHIVGPFGFFFDRGVYHILRTVDLDAYLRLLERTLQPGAMGLIIAGNAKMGRTGPPVVTEEELRGELGRLFTIERVREFYLDPVGENGETHLGWSCLLKRHSLQKK
jgi:SAM-dependent methyltransferase